VAKLRRPKVSGATRTATAANRLANMDFPPINLTAPRTLIREAGGTAFLEGLAGRGELQWLANKIAAAYDAKKDEQEWLTQADFARDMNISRQQATKILNAHGRPEYLKGISFAVLRRLWKMLDLHGFDDDDVTQVELDAIVTGLCRKRHGAGEKTEVGEFSPHEMSLVSAAVRELVVVDPKVLNDDRELACWLADRVEGFRADLPDEVVVRRAMIFTGAADWLAAREHLSSFTALLRKLVGAAKTTSPSTSNLKADALELLAGLVAIGLFRKECVARTDRAGGRRKKTADPPDPQLAEIVSSYGLDGQSLQDPGVPLGCLVMQSRQLREYVRRLLVWNFGTSGLAEDHDGPEKEPEA
jgi:hypothetical protein